MRVPARDGEPGLRQAELGADDVHDALTRVIDPQVQDAVLARVVFEKLDHAADFRVGDAGDPTAATHRWHVVIGRSESLPGPANFAAFLGERTESVERPFVNQIAVDIDERFAFALHDRVLVPELVEQGSLHG